MRSAPRPALRRAGARLLWGLALVVMACPASDKSDAAPGLAIDDCSRPGVERKLRCGTLTVLEDSANPDGRTIPLEFVVLPARDGRRRSDAVLYLVGGPGLGATGSVSFLAGSIGAIQQSRDIILVDQRGSGRSNPLRCAMSPEETLEALYASRFRDRTLETCLEDLDADPRLYRSIEIAEDLDALRSALGYERLDLVGVSYGSRLALVYLRRFPDRVRTVALRGVASPAGNLLSDIGTASEDTMIRLLQHCSEDPACRAEFGDLERSLRRVLSRLEDHPKEIEVAIPGAKPIPFRLSRELFAGAIRLSLYSTKSAKSIPGLINDAGHDRWEALSSTLSGILRSGLPSSISFGSYLSIVCAEDVPFHDRSSTIFDREKFFLTPALPESLCAACRVWPHRAVDPDFKRPVTSSVPALLLSGSEDPATSADSAREIGEHLADHRHLVTPGLAHMPTWTGCFTRNLARFVDSGSTSAVDESCADDPLSDGPTFHRRSSRAAARGRR